LTARKFVGEIDPSGQFHQTIGSAQMRRHKEFVAISFTNKTAPNNTNSQPVVKYNF
jgi:hypothetical protein